MDAKVVFIIVAALFTYLQLAKAADPDVQAACETATLHTPGKIKVTAIFDAEATTLYAINKADSCGTGATAGTKIVFSAPTDTTDATPRKKYAFTIDATADKTTCGVTETGALASTDTASEISIVYTTGQFVTQDDKVFKIKCTWDKTTTNAVTSDSTVSGALAVSDVTGQTLAATLEIHEANAAATSVSINGKDCQLVLKIPDKTKLVNEAKVISCKTSRTSTDTTESKDMYENGCGKNIPPWTNSMFFKKEDDGAANSKIRYYKEDKHHCWKFDGHTTVYVECQVLGCVGGATECAAPTCPPTGKRRKRAVASNVTSERFETVFRVVNEVTYKQGEAKNLHAQCLNNMTWMTVIGVLAILLLITLGVALYFGSKAMRRQGERKDGCPNLAYKA